MRIRDIEKYVESILGGRSSMSDIGSDKEPLLSKIHGDGQQVKAHITGVANFASNSEEQFFYEFVQNAIDAEANSLFFFANSKYLIVLNNGEPFYTDSKESHKKRDGQLYNFLTKGKSLKFANDKKKGKYGQGSKLLYTLISDVGIGGNDAALLKAIHEEKKGPYLISWSNSSQLSNLLLNRGVWSYEDPCNEEDNMLVAKILMCYYPIAPGVDQALFSDMEICDVIKTFNELVDPKSNINRLKRGSALIIPLGEGQYEKITAADNIANVKTRIGGFASMNCDKTSEDVVSLERISIMGEEIAQVSAKTLSVEVYEDGNFFEYKFAFNPEFAKPGYANFLNVLPILQTKLGLGFMIDSPNFEMDSSRQRINDTLKTKEQLILAFKNLVVRLEEIKQDDKELFDYMYLSIIASNIPANDDSKYVKDAFDEVFIPFLRRNVLTTDGDYATVETAFSPSFDLNLPLQTLGIKEWQWVSRDIKQAHNRICGEFRIEDKSFKKTLEACMTLNLQKWIKELSPRDYIKFEANCCDISFRSSSTFKYYPLFRSNHGKVYSYYELTDGHTPIFSFKDKLPENIYNAFSDTLEFATYKLDSSAWAAITIKKITENITIFRDSNIGKECACSILEYIYKNYTSYQEQIKSGISLFQNHVGDYLPFNRLFNNRPQDTTLFDSFLIKGLLPQAARREWFVNSENHNVLWRCIANNFDSIKALDDWQLNSIQYLLDICDVYKKSKSLDDHEEIFLALYLNENGKPTDIPHQLISGADKLAEVEYKDMQILFSDIKLTPYKYAKTLSNVPFKNSEVKIGDHIANGQIVTKEQLAILIKLDSRILHKVIASEVNDGYELKCAKKDAIGYILPNSIQGVQRTNIERAMQQSGYNLIADSITPLLPEHIKSGYDLCSDREMLKIAITKCYGRKYLAPIIKDSDKEIAETFINEIRELNITASISADSADWQVMDLAIHRGLCDKLKPKIKHNGTPIPDKVVINDWLYNDRNYDLYELSKEIKRKNEKVEVFFSLLPDAQLFKNNYYQTVKDITADELFDKIHNTPLSIEGLLFCLDYSFINEIEEAELRIAKNVDLYLALEGIREREYKYFDRYFKIDGFDKAIQVYAGEQKFLLLEQELLPEPLNRWLGNGNAIDYISDLRTKEDSYILIRQAILSEIESNLDYNLFNCKNDVSIEQTKLFAEWLTKQEIDVVHSKSKYRIINNIINKIPRKCEHRIFLRYCGRIADDQHNNPIYNVERYSDEAFFLPSYDVVNNKEFKKLLSEDIYLLRTFQNNTIFESSYELAKKHDINDSHTLQLIDSTEIDNSQEWCDTTYERWKKNNLSQGVIVFIGDNDVNRNIKIATKDKCNVIYSKQINSSEFGFNSKEKNVVVKWTPHNKKSVMKKLEECSMVAEFFKEPFIALQGLYVEQFENVQKYAEKQGVDIENLISQATSNGGLAAGTSKNKLTDKTDEEIDLLESLADRFSSEEIDLLSRYKESVLDALSAAIEDEEEQESQVRKTIGYIGELIYERYLQKLNVGYEYSAKDGIGAYDFIRKDNNTYVDVKTSMYSIKDGTVPFYLHKSQSQFMQKNKEVSFRILRISLDDLNLKRSYEKVRDTYGADADYSANALLQEDCEKIASQYWKLANIQDFEESSPEFSISISKQIE